MKTDRLYQTVLGCLLLTAGCSDNALTPSLPEGTPLTVSAAICASGEGRESETRAAVAAGTRAVAADNGYDRSTFAAGDKIRIIRSGGLYIERRFFRQQYGRVETFGDGYGAAR